MIQKANSTSGSHRRQGLTYKISKEEIHQFNQDGYIVLNDVLTEKECQTLDDWFDHFIGGHESEKMRKDFCDMSQPYGTPMDEFQLINAINPAFYRPDFNNNIFQQVSRSITDQLYNNADIDYEQFLAKKPAKDQAAFAMHQDLGYWPMTHNTWTATFSLALSDSDLINGCLHVIPGSNQERQLRKHIPMNYGGKATGSRDDSHTLTIETFPDEKLVYLPVKRGSITIHDERIVHGSGGNRSNTWRKTYIIAYRDKDTIKQERSIGFTHSHNDGLDWKNILDKG